VTVDLAQRARDVNDPEWHHLDHDAACTANDGARTLLLSYSSDAELDESLRNASGESGV